MSVAELRWMLLVLGVAFLAGLAWWELRRPRQARGTGFGAAQHEEVEPEADMAASGGDVQVRVRREPTLTLPPIGVRDPLPELTTVELVDEPLGQMAIAPEEEPEEEVNLLASEEDRYGSDSELNGIDDPVGRSPAAPGELVGTQAPEPIVEWPEEDVRRIIALRLIAGEERFAGHAVRQALQSEGFALGKLSIFHRPGSDGRAIVSAASLTRPGTFERESIDRQRFGGLCLFAVLPGPLPAHRAFDELLTSASRLRERLHGELQDEHGEKLTPQRTAELREAIEGAAGHDA